MRKRPRVVPHSDLFWTVIAILTISGVLLFVDKMNPILVLP